MKSSSSFKTSRTSRSSFAMVVYLQWLQAQGTCHFDRRVFSGNYRSGGPILSKLSHLMRKSPQREHWTSRANRVLSAPPQPALPTVVRRIHPPSGGIYDPFTVRLCRFVTLPLGRSRTTSHRHR